MKILWSCSWRCGDFSTHVKAFYLIKSHKNDKNWNCICCFSHFYQKYGENCQKTKCLLCEIYLFIFCCGFHEVHLFRAFVRITGARINWRALEHFEALSSSGCMIIIQKETRYTKRNTKKYEQGQTPLIECISRCIHKHMCTTQLWSVIVSLSLFATAPTASSPPFYGSGTVFAVGPEDSSFMLRVINRLSHALS